MCLVRAYLADPAVLVLDEATSAVDVHTERRIQRALRRLCEGRTAIIIAHRLATIRDADRIAVIRNGQLVELGPHTQLIDQNGAYAALYQTYLRSAETSASIDTILEKAGAEGDAHRANHGRGSGFNREKEWPANTKGGPIKRVHPTSRNLRDRPVATHRE